LPGIAAASAIAELDARFSGAFVQAAGPSKLSDINLVHHPDEGEPFL
jgi:hypothetical protein